MRRLREWLGRLIRDHLVQDEPMDELDFYGGGPKDGDREQVGAERHEWVVTAVVRPVMSPWIHDDVWLDLAGTVVVVGRYVRTGSGMAWRPA